MAIRSTLVGVPAFDTRLLGDLSVPDSPSALALVAHTSATNRWHPRERRLIAALRSQHLASFRLDLLTRDEAAFDATTRRSRTDTGVLAKRVLAAMDWVLAQAQFANLPVGYIGTGIGGAAVLAAACDRPVRLDALVLIDGRTDRVAAALDGVQAPTLLVAARDNTEIAAMNERVLPRLRCFKHLQLVDGITSLLEHPDGLNEAARLVSDWFERFLGPSRSPRTLS